MSEDSVGAAYEILLEELSTYLAEVTQTMQRTVQNKDFEATQRLAEQARHVKAMQEQVTVLFQQWRQILHGTRGRGAKFKLSRDRRLMRGVRRRVTPRIQQGLAIPWQGYKRPLLEALVNLGGAAPPDRVLQRVQEAMKERFNERDLETLSVAGQPRWVKNVHWCRYFLVRQGLLNPHAPRGIWEITELGRKALERERASSELPS